VDVKRERETRTRGVDAKVDGKRLAPRALKKQGPQVRYKIEIV